MNLKKLGLILLTILVAAINVVYLYKIYVNYDHGLFQVMTAFTVTIPLTAFIDLWWALTGRRQQGEVQKLWYRIFIFLLMLSGLIFSGYNLIKSDFYDLNYTLLTVATLVLSVATLTDCFRSHPRTIKHPVLNWAISIMAVYCVTSAIIFTYIQVVQPVTVSEAKEIVAQAYGEDSYEFSSHLNFHQEDCPLGVYWFAQRKAELDGWVQVDLLTGELLVV